MPLSTLKPIGFIPSTASAEDSRAFFEKTLGLPFVNDDKFAMVFRMGTEEELMLRVVRFHPDHFKPTHATIFGWEAPDIEAAVDQLTARGVTFERYGHFEQDDRAIWTTPTGDKVAWFKDPTGNVLSLSQHTHRPS